MSIKIESGVPMPSKNTGGMSQTMRQMKVGDSFVLPSVKRPSVHTCARNAGIKVAMRTADGITRVWRIE